jgi:hypothetical protein
VRPPSRTIYLPPGHYRLRRRRDAVRLLPVLGGFLFLLPVLWAPGDTPEPDTGRNAIYLFAVWAGLILAAGLLSRRLAEDPPGPAGGSAAQTGED